MDSSAVDRRTKSKPVHYYFNSSQYNYILQKEVWKDQQRAVHFAEEKKILKMKEKQLWTNYMSQFGVMLCRS